jgi:hypothetical protein
MKKVISRTKTVILSKAFVNSCRGMFQCGMGNKSSGKNTTNPLNNQRMVCMSYPSYGIMVNKTDDSIN